MENVLLTALGSRQEVAAVCAKDQGTNCSHFRYCALLLDCWIQTSLLQSRARVGIKPIFFSVSTKKFSGSCDQEQRIPPQTGKHGPFY